MDLSQTEFIHVRKEHGYNFSGTIAFRRLGDTLQVGYSMLSPRDQFCKKIGRDVSEARLLEKTRNYFEITCFSDSIKDCMRLAVQTTANTITEKFYGDS